MAKLYVGNLPFEYGEDEIKNVFSQAGEVKHIKIVTDAFDGRSRGFGFVEMTREEEADTAIANLNGVKIEGRTLRVDRAKSQSTDKGDTKSGKMSGVPRPGGSYRTWV